MDKVKAIIEKGKAAIQKGKEQELFQTHDDYQNPDATTEWKEFLKSAHYSAVLPAGYLDVDKLQDDPTFCIQTSIHQLEIQARCVVLIKQFNSYKGNSDRNQLLISDIVYYNLAHDTAETEVWRGILNFRQSDTTYTNNVTQLPKIGLGEDDIATAIWHPVFGPKYVRPAPRNPGGMTFNSEEALDADCEAKREVYRCEGTSARLTRAPTFGSSTASDREWVSSVLNGYLNVSDEWLVHDPPASIISNCPALINHDHECTAPVDLLPASPVLNSVPTPPAAGLDYTGPNPSATLNQRLDDHVDAPIAGEEVDLESASQRKANLEYRIIVAILLIVFIGGSIAAIIGAIIIASKRKCNGPCF
ncbi:hypothetical protein OCU04_012231 [Sclerotinia nivalis]|uniref:Uncharacterized protein n=1 Tax=Sclerotinia nivalis TaxID=352851 RepID=A0A9X0DDB1_9HELO|nr:hypothetical protein OCU04_012231 [Sclerotinia nivalis]